MSLPHNLLEQYEAYLLNHPTVSNGWSLHSVGSGAVNAVPPPVAEPTTVLNWVDAGSAVLDTAGDYVDPSTMTTLTKAPRKPPVREKKYNLPIRKLHPIAYTPDDQLIGVEIECEGKFLFTTPTKYWLAKGDNSLRPVDGHQPVEYVLSNPLSRSDLDKALNYLLARIQKTSTLSLSQRCSVHVHLNCQNLTMKQVITFVCAYLTLEELLVEWCGEERVGNLFCLRAKDAHHFVKVIEDCIRNDSYSPMGSDNVRYTSCNVAALGKFGSVEFRSLRGVVDKPIISTWVDMLLKLRERACDMTDPRVLVDVFTKLGPKKYLKFMLGDNAELFLKRPDYDKIIWDGVRLIREIAYASEWAPPLPEKKPRKKAA